MGCCQSADSDVESVQDYSRPGRSTPQNHWNIRQETSATASTRPTSIHPSVRNIDQREQSVLITRPSSSHLTTVRNIKPVEPFISTIQPTTNRVPSGYDIRPVQNPVSTISPTVSHLSPVFKINPVENLRTTKLTIWKIHELLAETNKIDASSAKNIVQLFGDQNTIPFIYRYRRDLISSNITPDKLRDIKNAYTEIVGLRKRAEIIARELEPVFFNDEIRGKILNAKTAKELEFLHAVYKPAVKDARALGLEEHANRLLTGSNPPIQLQRIVDHSNPDLNTNEKVKNGICQLISQQLSTNTEVLNELRREQNVQNFVLKCSKTEVHNDPASITHYPSRGKRNDQSKYEKYFNFEIDTRRVRSHQILAINRGEALEFLSVEIKVSDNFKLCVRSFIYGKFMWQGIHYQLRTELFEKAFEECYTEKLFPLVCRQVRANLTEVAKREAVDVFAKNLKQLLLMPPLKGERILGIDPGFRHGCKLAIISETTDLLAVSVLHPHTKKNDPEKCGLALAKLLARHSCKMIALGNGTACRETESWLRQLFHKGILDKESVSYVIVSEQGASVYSCSREAKKEFPNLDVNLISAVSIARRLNDPLSEYAKIEPRHLGIGMYQHDINEAFLSKSLNEVVTECVSFVGVDINTASLSLLKHVAGLNENRAENIIQYRQKYGPFRTRRDLLQVPTIEEKSFIQCAGFVRIEPKSVGGKVSNVLDCTWVHPESYELATKIITQCKLELKDIGKPDFILKIEAFAKAYSTETLVNHYGIPTKRVKAVLEALQRELFQDYRKDFEKTLYKSHITRIEDLFIGEIVTGEVRNVVGFGAFVDIGLNFNGLIHNTKMDKIKLKIGDRVTATVLEIDISKRHVQLRLDELI